jgi:hypothetical protein
MNRTPRASGNVPLDILRELRKVGKTWQALHLMKSGKALANRLPPPGS